MSRYSDQVLLTRLCRLANKGTVLEENMKRELARVMNFDDLQALTTLLQRFHGQTTNRYGPITRQAAIELSRGYYDQVAEQYRYAIGWLVEIVVIKWVDAIRAQEVHTTEQQRHLRDRLEGALASLGQR